MAPLRAGTPVPIVLTSRPADPEATEDKGDTSGIEMDGRGDTVVVVLDSSGEQASSARASH